MGYLYMTTPGDFNGIEFPKDKHRVKIGMSSNNTSKRLEFYSNDRIDYKICIIKKDVNLHSLERRLKTCFNESFIRVKTCANSELFDGNLEKMKEVFDSIVTKDLIDTNTNIDTRKKKNNFLMRRKNEMYNNRDIDKDIDKDKYKDIDKDIDKNKHEKWYTNEKNHEYLENIKEFVYMINNNIEKNIEKYTKKNIAFRYLIKSFTALDLITTDEDGRLTLDISSTFTCQDIEDKVLPIFKSFKQGDFHHILHNKGFSNKRKEVKKRTVKSILHQMLQCWFNYEIKKISEKRHTVNKKQVRTATFKIVPKEETCIWSAFY